jgi:hypothetical protein
MGSSIQILNMSADGLRYFPHELAIMTKLHKRVSSKEYLKPKPCLHTHAELVSPLQANELREVGDFSSSFKEAGLSSSDFGQNIGELGVLRRLYDHRVYRDCLPNLFDLPEHIVRERSLILPMRLIQLSPEQETSQMLTQVEARAGDDLQGAN